MRLLCFFLLGIFLCSACKEQKKEKSNLVVHEGIKETLKYAKGFSITYHKNYTEIIVSSPYPKSKENYRYIVTTNTSNIPKNGVSDITVTLPIEKLVVMSTTNIPALEYLDVDDKLVGFPSTRFISSEKTRARVDSGAIKDLNNDLDLNMELLLDLQPDLVIGFSVNGNDKTLNQIKKFGIPVVLDGAWTEAHPLGSAEWVKFIAAFFNKKDKADSIFNTIETNYLQAKQLALNATKRPVVLSGSMFKEVWNVPGGKSFVAKYLEDANTNYLWKDTDTNGSLQFNFENVLEKAQNAELWIGAGAFNSREQMANQHKGYTYFDAFKNKNIFTYTNKIGPDGGLLYYELGPLRPDFILKDIIHIAHPDLLPNYNNFFFKRLE
ncbi:ABC transporter substrate-binding protein [Tamlana fucoidanivorans]|uniref:ABC transporter substrate-binding protein n=1 Tax=Allotamlana fucoidanivorans TaxID=2583814 RepID=A0A5C4SI97_9FLAO|nr:ABC transporter substrate-binding protein [Tamlana fucoidanivorans]TNJ43463.1 ABC transporter substrate-binding protein [Tamlana fucoidanivorans]